LIEALPQKESGLVSESVQPRPDLLDHAKLFRREQDTQHPESAKTEAGRCVTGLLLIEEYDLGLQLDRKSKSFSFPSIEIAPQGQDQILVRHFVTVNPSGALDLLTPRVAPSSLIQLAPDTVSNVDLAIESPKKLEMADCGETGQG
jgi:hypothetical protein